MSLLSILPLHPELGITSSSLVLTMPLLTSSALPDSSPSALSFLSADLVIPIVFSRTVCDDVKDVWLRAFGEPLVLKKREDGAGIQEAQ